VYYLSSSSKVAAEGAYWGSKLSEKRVIAGLEKELVILAASMWIA
jgi:hypothetical protein